MGFPVRYIQCTKCGFEDPIPPSPMRVSYLLPSGRSLAARRALGWCSTCNHFTDGESVPTPESIEAQGHAFVAAEKERLRGEQSWLARVLGLSIGTIALPVEFDEAASVFAKRRAKAKCFKCGQAGHEPVTTVGEKHIEHPRHACGGSFEWKDLDPNGIRVSNRLVVLVLSVEGDILQRTMI